MTKTTQQISLLVEIDQYAGNWEREISGYLFGFCDDHGEHVAKDTIAMFNEQVSGDDAKFGIWLTNRPVDEYGMMPYTIYIPEGGKECSGIEFFLSDQITKLPNKIDDLVDYVKRRFGDGISVPQRFVSNPKIETAKLVRLRLKTETIIEEIKDV
jgi:hypothetical protein